MKGKILNKYVRLILTIALFFGWFNFSYAVDIEVKVPEEYVEVRAGEEIGFDIDIKYPENPSRKEIELNYEIKKGDDVLLRQKDSKFIETGALFAKFISIPDDADTGLYVLNVDIVDFGEVIKSDSVNFYIIGNKEEKIRMYFLVVFGAIIALVFGFIIARDLIKRGRVEESDVSQ